MHQDHHSQPTRKYTRIVCVSDTHNTQPSLPKGDVLIHAGDLTNQGSYSELRRTVNWLGGIQGFKLTIVVAGNHDLQLDQGFWKQHSGSFARNSPCTAGRGDNGDDSDGVKARDLLASASSSAGICYLEHEARTFEIPNETGDGTMTRLKVFGSPYSPRRGQWAFGYPAQDGAERWAEIPLDADLVITHTPPRFHCDESPSRGGGPAGCEHLRRALWRVRPFLVVCGHVHEARGVESVLWDLEASDVRYKESETFCWPDETLGSKRQFRVDLTFRSVRPLRNDGARGEIDATLSESSQEAREVKLPEAEPSGGRRVASMNPTPGSETVDLWHPTPSHGTDVESRLGSKVDAEAPIHGVGGLPTSDHCDVEALAGRQGRRETCIVNAAILGSSWPHRSPNDGGKKINKPIVIDLELPVVQA